MPSCKYPGSSKTLLPGLGCPPCLYSLPGLGVVLGGGRGTSMGWDRSPPAPHTA